MEASSIRNQHFYKQLLCFHYFQESKYPRQAVKAMNRTYGAEYISLSTVQKFYRQFAEPQFNLDYLMETYRDGTYSHLDDKLEEKENEKQHDTRSLENSDFIVRIQNYMEENPNAVLRQLKAHFGLNPSTISKYLHLAGYRFIIDKWIKQDSSQSHTDESITDDQIRHYQQENPEASLNDMAQHFMINRGALSKRIRRSVGLQLPSSAKKSAKKRANQDNIDEAIQENDINSQLNDTKRLGSKRRKTSSKKALFSEQPVDLSSDMLSPPLTPPQVIFQELSPEQLDKVLELATSAAIQNIITKNIFDRCK